MADDSDQNDRTEEEIRQALDAYVERSPYRYNPDEKVVSTVFRGLTVRKMRTGHAYCPCRVATGNEEQDAKIVCPCAFHEQEIAQNGICHCQLLVSEDYGGK